MLYFSCGCYSLLGRKGNLQTRIQLQEVRRGEACGVAVVDMIDDLLFFVFVSTRLIDRSLHAFIIFPQTCIGFTTIHWLYNHTDGRSSA